MELGWRESKVRKVGRKPRSRSRQSTIYWQGGHLPLPLWKTRDSSLEKVNQRVFGWWCWGLQAQGLENNKNLVAYAESWPSLSPSVAPAGRLLQRRTEWRVLLCEADIKVGQCLQEAPCFSTSYELLVPTSDQQQKTMGKIYEEKFQNGS